MKKMLTAAASMLLACSISHAQTSAPPKGLVAQLNEAAGDYSVAAFKASLDMQLASQKRDMDNRVAMATMSSQQFEQKLQADAAKGPDTSALAPLAPAWKSTHDKGRAAYEAWIAGKTPAQVAEAKKLYAAWLTRLDAMSHIDGDPNNVDQTPAGVAYEQAVNEFNIDNPE
ncbi:hypothetical protein [Aerosticca soli]|uniref:hypothetical protein n=1 Tax=Aerosticca soli TaxID=2010829 RepID=UPI000F8327A9|nr:hypothetical protein [Aerosticca soli]